MSKKKEIRRLTDLLEDAWERMDRARNILTDDNPRPECNWGILDTTLDRRRFDDSEELAAAPPMAYSNPNGVDSEPFR